jgi:hypothetical protein
MAFDQADSCFSQTQPTIPTLIEEDKEPIVMLEIPAEEGFSTAWTWQITEVD